MPIKPSSRMRNVEGPVAPLSASWGEIGIQGDVGMLPAAYVGEDLAFRCAGRADASNLERAPNWLPRVVSRWNAAGPDPEVGSRRPQGYHAIIEVVRCKPQRLANVPRFEFGILGKQLFSVRVQRHGLYHPPDGKPHAAQGWLTAPESPGPW